jgi:hypothetical protein
MMPVGPLMIEHRHIERLIELLRQEMHAIFPSRRYENFSIISRR